MKVNGKAGAAYRMLHGGPSTQHEDTQYTVHSFGQYSSARSMVAVYTCTVSFHPPTWQLATQTSAAVDPKAVPLLQGSASG